MIFDPDRRPRGITLIKLPSAGAKARSQSNLTDTIPLLDAGSADASHWRPDVTDNQNWQFPSTVNGYPLAKGAMAANHKRREATRLTFDAVVVDTPLVPFGQLGGLPGVRRADALLAALYALRDTQDFIAVVSPVRIIPTANVTNIILNRTAEDGAAYFVTLEIEEARVFDLKLVASIDDAAAQLGAATTTAGGVVIG
jgi:hypothetical protein